MARYHACAVCGCPGVEPGFARCGACAGKPVPTTTLASEQAAAESLADLRAAESLRLLRAWEAWRLTLLLRARSM